MTEGKITSSSIRCRLMMWRYNTQKHRTVNDVPYCQLFGQMPCIGFPQPTTCSGTFGQTLATKAEQYHVCDYVGKEPVPLDDAVVHIDGTEVALAAAAEATTVAAITVTQAILSNEIISKYNREKGMRLTISKSLV